MAALFNSRHEAYAQNLSKGMSQRAAYRAAFPNSDGMSDGSVDTRAYDIAHRPDVEGRVRELNEAAASEAIINRRERMILLSNIATDESQHPKQRMEAINILNRMDGEYVNKIEAKVISDMSAAAAQVEAILDE